MRCFDTFKRHQSSYGTPSPEATQRYKVMDSGGAIIPSLGTQPEIVFLENGDNIRLQGGNGTEGIDPVHAFLPVLVFLRT
jgi:hypothetical protein